MDKATEHLFSKDEIKQRQQEILETGRQVESVLKSPGWKLFQALFRQKAIEIREKEDYASLEDFRADRAAIRIVRGILDEFIGYATDADGAIQMLESLHKSERRTPSPLALDTGIMAGETKEEG